MEAKRLAFPEGLPRALVGSLLPPRGKDIWTLPQSLSRWGSLTRSLNVNNSKGRLTVCERERPWPAPGKVLAVQTVTLGLRGRGRPSQWGTVSHRPREVWRGSAWSESSSLDPGQCPPSLGWDPQARGMLAAALGGLGFLPRAREASASPALLTSPEPEPAPHDGAALLPGDSHPPWAFCQQEVTRSPPKLEQVGKASEPQKPTVLNCVEKCLPRTAPGNPPRGT